MSLIAKAAAAVQAAEKLAAKGKAEIAKITAATDAAIAKAKAAVEAARITGE